MKFSMQALHCRNRTQAYTYLLAKKLQKPQFLLIRCHFSSSNFFSYSSSYFYKNTVCVCDFMDSYFFNCVSCIISCLMWFLSDKNYGPYAERFISIFFFFLSFPFRKTTRIYFERNKKPREKALPDKVTLTS